MLDLLLVAPRETTGNRTPTDGAHLPLIEKVQSRQSFRGQEGLHQGRVDILHPWQDSQVQSLLYGRPLLRNEAMQQLNSETQDETKVVPVETRCGLPPLHWSRKRHWVDQRTPDPPEARSRCYRQGARSVAAQALRTQCTTKLEIWRDRESYSRGDDILQMLRVWHKPL